MSRLPGCSRCGATLPGQPNELFGLEACPACGVRTRVAVFPALNGQDAFGGTPAAFTVTDGEACCFIHSGKRAVAPCDGCGRFLCALCDMEMNGRHFCPSCLENWAKKGRIQELERQRTRYDQIVWSLLVLPLLILWPVMALTAGAALAVAIWKWNAPSSVVNRSRLSLAIAIPVAVAEIGLCGAFWVSVFNR